MSYSDANPAVAKSVDELTKERMDSLESSGGPEYPNVFPMNFPGGLFYIDSTPGKEKIRIRHKSGSFITFDADGDIFISPEKDLKILTERNTIMKTGTSVKENGGSDKMVIQVVGDAHLQVQNDLHVEVWGNKYETVNKNYTLTVKGDYIQSSANKSTVTKGVNTENCYEKVNENTFQTNRIGVPGPDGVGGQVKDVIFGNRVIEMADPRGIFSIISAGTLELISDIDMRTVVGGVSTLSVDGSHTESIGGAFTSTVGGAANIKVGGLMNINTGGVFKVTAPQIFLN